MEEKGAVSGMVDSASQGARQGESAPVIRLRYSHSRARSSNMRRE